MTEWRGLEWPRAVLVSAALAAHLWPGQSPLGKLIAFQLPGDEHRPLQWIEVVGIVGDVRVASTGGPALAVYAPNPPYFAPLIVRLRSEPAHLVQNLRSLMEQIDPSMVVTRAVPVSTELAREQYPSRLAGTVLAVTGQLGVALALIGLYGALTYNVARRTREIGTRVALGAQHADIVGLVGKDGLVTSVAGLVCGIVGATLLSTLVSTQLAVPTTDRFPAIVALTLLVLALAGMASYIPAARAAGVDPSVALRHE